MKKSTLLQSLMLAAVAVPGVAMAEDANYSLSSNIGLVSDYVFRGITQTIGKPALQGGIDYARKGGFYIGVWGSNVSWVTGSGSTGEASLELDTYLGYRGGFAGDFSYDVGAIRFNYLGDYTPSSSTTTPVFQYAKADTSEFYGAIGYKWITAKYSYSLGDFLMVPEAKGTSYAELNASYTLEGSGVTLGAHYGTQTYKGTATDALVLAGYDPSYSDYKVSVSKDFSGYVLGLAYSDTDAKSGGYYTYPSNGKASDWGDKAVVVSLTHAM